LTVPSCFTEVLSLTANRKNPFSRQNGRARLAPDSEAMSSPGLRLR
jgi:hypothetical protein